MEERRYLLSSQRWLERTWKRLTKEGKAHQPLYGFSHRHLYTPGTTERYAVTHRILEVLSSLRFRSLLDVGGGEGYRAALARRVFGLRRVVVADLSSEACRRAKRFFSLPCVVAEAHFLPFRSESFDVVLTAETLEHVMKAGDAVREMTRVARKAVVIAVNRKSPSLVKRYPKRFPYDVSSFNKKSFDFLEEEGCSIFSWGMVSPITRFFGILLDAQPRRHSRFWSFPSFFTSLYNRLCPFLRRMGREKFLHPILWLDPLLVRLTGYRALLFLILKGTKKGKGKRLHPSFITGFRVGRGCTSKNS